MAGLSSHLLKEMAGSLLGSLSLKPRYNLPRYIVYCIIVLTTLLVLDCPTMSTPIAKVQPSGAKGKSDLQWLRHPRPWPWRPKMRSRTLAQGRAFRVLLEGWDDGICQNQKILTNVYPLVN